jgi:alkylation response protein AidB-like acyl-CoA dehydrogenase
MADVQSLLVANEKLSQEVLRPGADQIDQSRRFPRENIAALGKAGVLGLLVPAQFGGAGASLGEMSFPAFTLITARWSKCLPCKSSTRRGTRKRSLAVPKLATQDSAQQPSAGSFR